MTDQTYPTKYANCHLAKLVSSATANIYVCALRHSGKLLYMSQDCCDGIFILIPIILFICKSMDLFCKGSVVAG